MILTRSAKIIYPLAALIGLAGGSFVGFRLGAEASRDFHSAQRIAAAMELTNFSYLQYRHADSSHAKEALLTCTAFLEELEKAHPDAGQRGELAMAYTRLALLEDTVQDASQSQAYMNRARFWHEANGHGLKDRSDAEIKAGQKRMDDALGR